MTLQETPYYFLALCSLILINFITGNIVLRVFRVKMEDSLVNFLLSSLIGSLTIVSTVAILKTSFQSIFILVFPLTLFFTYQLKTNPIVSRKIGNKFYSDFIFLALIGIVLFLLRIIAFTQTKADILADNYSSDNLFYGRISEFLMLSGVENTDNVYAFLEEYYKGMTPYHYFELWLSGIIAHLWGLNTFYAYSFITHTYFLLLLAAATLILLKHFLSNLSLLFIYPITILFIFSSIIYFNFFFKFNGFFEIYHFINGRHSANFFIMKRAIAELFWLTSFILIAKRSVTSGIVLLLIFALCFTTPAPGIFGAIVIFAILGYVFKDKLSSIRIAWALLPFLLTILFAVLYFLFKPSVSSFNAYLKTENYSLTAYFVRLLRNGLHFPLVYFPFSLILPIVIWRRFNLLKSSSFFIAASVLVGCTLTVGLFFGSLLPAYDWVQFYDTNAYVLFKIIMTVFLLIAIIKLFDYKSPVYWLFLLSFAYLGFRTLRAHQLDIQPRASIVHEGKYLQEVKEVLDSLSKAHKVVHVGVLNSAQTQERFLKRGKVNINFETIADYLYHFCPNQAIINLSWVHVYDTKERYSDETEARWRTSFFMNSLKKYPELIGRDKNETLMNFIKKYHIHYLLIAKDAEIPSELSAFSQKIIVDSETGERFVLLKSY